MIASWIATFWRYIGKDRSLPLFFIFIFNILIFFLRRYYWLLSTSHFLCKKFLHFTTKFRKFQTDIMSFIIFIYKNYLCIICYYIMSFIIINYKNYLCIICCYIMRFVIIYKNYLCFICYCIMRFIVITYKNYLWIICCYIMTFIIIIYKNNLCIICCLSYNLWYIYHEIYY